MALCLHTGIRRAKKKFAVVTMRRTAFQIALWWAQTRGPQVAAIPALSAARTLGVKSARRAPFKLEACQAGQKNSCPRDHAATCLSDCFVDPSPARSKSGSGGKRVEMKDVLLGLEKRMGTSFTEKTTCAPLVTAAKARDSNTTLHSERVKARFWRAAIALTEEIADLLTDVMATMEE